LGRVVDVERPVTAAVSTNTATIQAFLNGTVYSITSGLLNGRVFTVVPPVLSVYLANNAHDGFLGLPSSDDIILPNGRHRQTFQGGLIEYDPGADPILKLPVDTVTLTPTSGGTIRMKLGESVQLTALLLAANGANLTGRVVNWTTSNSRVVTIQANGAMAALKAAGGGMAFVQATSEGKTSPQVSVVVTAPCCQVGEGAPDAVTQQSFQDAITRNRLSIALPTPNPVRRAGAGYVQDVQTTATPPVRYLLAKPDRVSTTYVVSGELLAAYEKLGGPAGAFGHPQEDPTAGGRQLFDGGALAGSPVRQVAGAILSKWRLLGYETGSAGLPAGDAAAALASSAFPGVVQSFLRGTILGATSGPRANQAFFVSGLILLRYSALGGPGGALGFPVSDEFGSDGRRRQNFEGGYVDYGPGDSSASANLAERRPSVSASPAAVAAGTRVRIALSGFPDSSVLRVSITGQPDFIVTTPNGAFAWEFFVPLSAAGGSVTIRAVDPAGGAAAETSYSVKPLSAARLQLAKIRGDGQAGLPGTQLRLPLRVALRDENGSAIAGAPILFTASPGAQIVQASIATDENGEADALVRLPPSESVALVAAESFRVVTTFSLRAQAAALQSVPRFATANRKDSLIAAAAAILRYHQNRNELPGAPLDPASLAQYLQNFCTFDADANQICDGLLAASDPGEKIANLWRVPGAVNGQVEVAGERAEPAVIRDLLADGSPVLLALSLAAGDAPAGGHFVVATGVTADGSIAIMDPNPALGRGTLEAYLNGFDAAGQKWKGVLAGVVRLLPSPPRASGFLLSALSQPAAAGQGARLEITSISGVCGQTVDIPESTPPLAARFRYCQGTASEYQLTVASSSPVTVAVTDLAQGGRVSPLSAASFSAFRATRPSLYLAIGPQETNFTVGGVVNPATYQAGIATNGLASIFGNGLAATEGDTMVEIGGRTATVLAKSAFQVNVALPADLPLGSQTMQVKSPFGVAQQQVDVQEVAPAIFSTGEGQAAITHPDGKLVTRLNPARRGQVVVLYATGMGAVTQSGAVQVARTPAKVVYNGVELTPAFAGQAPGFPGLNQVNVVIPQQGAPGLDVTLVLRQGTVDSNPVTIAVQ
jgi:uncharacterized protein (TIGR03437 family)